MKMAGKLTNKTLDVIDPISLKNMVETEKDKKEIIELKKQIIKLRYTVVEAYDITSEIKEGLKELPKLNVKRPTKISNHKPDSCLILPLFDLHIGHLYKDD